MKKYAKVKTDYGPDHSFSCLSICGQLILASGIRSGSNGSRGKFSRKDHSQITRIRFFPFRVQMDTSIHTMQTLFCQLGLPGDEEQINAFIEKHSPLPRNIVLSEADFWNEAQAAFLTVAIEENSDWCELVDELDCLLREN